MHCFLFQFPLSSLFLKVIRSCLLLLPPLPVIFVLPFIFPSITCLRRQFLREMWPIQLNFLLCILFRIFLSFLTLHHSSSFLTRYIRPIFSPFFQHHISDLPRYFWTAFRIVQVSAPYKTKFQITSIVSKIIWKTSALWRAPEHMHRMCKDVIPTEPILIASYHAITLQCRYYWILKQLFPLVAKQDYVFQDTSKCCAATLTNRYSV